MSSKIVINIHTNTDDEATVTKQTGMSDSVPAPPASDASDMHEAAAGSRSIGQAALSGGAPAPPRDDTADERSPDNDKSEAGPPEFSDDMTFSKSESDTSMQGDAPIPPANHPDIAGDDSVTSVSSGPPMPPSDDADADEDDNDSGKKKGGKGSAGKKKKK